MITNPDFLIPKLLQSDGIISMNYALGKIINRNINGCKYIVIRNLGFVINDHCTSP